MTALCMGEQLPPVPASSQSPRKPKLTKGWLSYWAASRPLRLTKNTGSESMLPHLGLLSFWFGVLKVQRLFDTTQAFSGMKKASLHVYFEICNTLEHSCHLGHGTGHADAKLKDAVMYDKSQYDGWWLLLSLVAVRSFNIWFDFLSSIWY